MREKRRSAVRMAPTVEVPLAATETVLCQRFLCAEEKKLIRDQILLHSLNTQQDPAATAGMAFA